jgi:hypothetical protein
MQRWVYVHSLKLSWIAASQRLSVACHVLPSTKRRRTLPLADADANAVLEPDLEQPASHAGEELVFAGSAAGYSTGAPGISFPEADTSADVFRISFSNIQQRMDPSDRVSGELIV